MTDSGIAIAKFQPGTLEDQIKVRVKKKQHSETDSLPPSLPAFREIAASSSQDSHYDSGQPSLSGFPSPSLRPRKRYMYVCVCVWSCDLSSGHVTRVLEMLMTWLYRQAGSKTMRYIIIIHWDVKVLRFQHSLSCSVLEFQD